MSSEKTGRSSITTWATSPGETWVSGLPWTLGSTPSPTSIIWSAGPPPVVRVMRQEAAPDTPITACATPCNNAVGPTVVAVRASDTCRSISIEASSRSACSRRDQRLEPLLVKEQAAHLDVEQLRQLGCQGAEVLAKLGEVGDGGRRLEEVTELLEVLVRPAGELEVQLDDAEVLEAPEPGED